MADLYVAWDDPRWGEVTYPLFTLHTTAEREWLTVDGFPRLIGVDAGLKEVARPEWVQWREDGTLRFTVENGWCTYRVLGYGHARDQYLCERMDPA